MHKKLTQQLKSNFGPLNLVNVQTNLKFLFCFAFRVLILDFDIHHGNGTQEIFKEDNS